MIIMFNADNISSGIFWGPLYFLFVSLCSKERLFSFSRPLQQDVRGHLYIFFTIQYQFHAFSRFSSQIAVLASEEHRKIAVPKVGTAKWIWQTLLQQLLQKLAGAASTTILIPTKMTPTSAKYCYVTFDSQSYQSDGCFSDCTKVELALRLHRAFTLFSFWGFGNVLTGFLLLQMKQEAGN